MVNTGLTRVLSPSFEPQVACPSPCQRGWHTSWALLRSCSRLGRWTAIGLRRCPALTKPLLGEPVEGQPSDGQPSDGQPLDGQTSDGQPLDGHRKWVRPILPMDRSAQVNLFRLLTHLVPRHRPIAAVRLPARVPEPAAPDAEEPEQVRGAAREAGRAPRAAATDLLEEDRLAARLRLAVYGLGKSKKDELHRLIDRFDRS